MFLFRFTLVPLLLAVKSWTAGGLSIQSPNGDPVLSEHTFWSGKGQDKWVLETLVPRRGKDGHGRGKEGGSGLHNGFFVELAANKPFKNSNSAFLEQDLGWKGICVEPLDYHAAELRRERKCSVFEEIVDCAAGRQVEWIGRDGLSGVIANDTDNKPKIANATDNKPKMTTRFTDTLENILDKANAPRTIDYLSLDVEGSEWRALKNFPFDKYTFRTMTIERPPPWLNSLLFSNGYLFVKNYDFDSFYIHKSCPESMRIAKQEEFVQIGTKCLDNYGAGIPHTDCPWPEQVPQTEC